jgi:hypothetical protein
MLRSPTHVPSGCQKGAIKRCLVGSVSPITVDCSGLALPEPPCDIPSNVQILYVHHLSHSVSCPFLEGTVCFHIRSWHMKIKVYLTFTSIASSGGPILNWMSSWGTRHTTSAPASQCLLATTIVCQALFHINWLNYAIKWSLLIPRLRVAFVL